MSEEFRDDVEKIIIGLRALQKADETKDNAKNRVDKWCKKARGALGKPSDAEQQEAAPAKQTADDVIGQFRRVAEERAPQVKGTATTLLKCAKKAAKDLGQP